MYCGCQNPVDADHDQLLLSEPGSSGYYYLAVLRTPGGTKLPHTGGPMGLGIGWMYLDDLLAGNLFKNIRTSEPFSRL